ncbi:hypothetical protein LZQ00_15340 [Sphingobacterium sp. SRCM116780]|uniref:hypothetical protein n=1 Tax=Sphingobacterium sp. SRCM116780 TaxID=2907623 RepID=UPI001F45C14A|nr:hypothetical protein [Sphingobacterium sp. SRCM116780]UIR55631.1 hypothetical protein LZQ00_15340 [Sphingobacterium sp. SRCM116780]
MNTSKTKKRSWNTFRYRYVSIICLSIGLVTFMGCTKKQAEEPTPKPPTGTETVTTANVSYTNFIKGLLEVKCSSCHASGQSASGNWTFNGYNSVKDNASRINNMVVVTKAMPKSGSLTAKEIELVSAWIQRSTPEN